jgi:aspartate kinase
LATVVQKWGGSTLGSIDQLKEVAAKILARQKQGDNVVVVASAMKGETDRLIDKALEITDLPNLREYDSMISTGEQVSTALLSIAIEALGGKACSMLGFQIPIRTSCAFKDARIEDIDGTQIKKLLRKGNVAIVAGFQGVDCDGNITTLGRGGTDTSAVAVAAAIRADVCELYKDVPGIATADPHIEPSARRLDKISYEEVLELASLGAKVLQIRAVEMAMKNNIPIHVRPESGKGPGTFVVKGDKEMEQIIVSGIALDKKESKVTVAHVPDKPGVAAALFQPLADNNIMVDMIIQNVSDSGFTDISFTVRDEDIARVKKITTQAAKKLGTDNIRTNKRIAKVSVVGLGMRSHAGVAAKIFKTLSKGGVNIMMISTSEIKVSCVVDENYGELTVRLLHEAFKLDKPVGKKAAKKKTAKKKKTSRKK